MNHFAKTAAAIAVGLFLAAGAVAAETPALGTQGAKASSTGSGCPMMGQQAAGEHGSAQHAMGRHAMHGMQGLGMHGQGGSGAGAPSAGGTGAGSEHGHR